MSSPAPPLGVGHLDDANSKIGCQQYATDSKRGCGGRNDHLIKNDKTQKFINFEKWTSPLYLVHPRRQGKKLSRGVLRRSTSKNFEINTSQVLNTKHTKTPSQNHDFTTFSQLHNSSKNQEKSCSSPTSDCKHRRTQCASSDSALAMQLLQYYQRHRASPLQDLQMIQKKKRIRIGTKSTTHLTL